MCRLPCAAVAPSVLGRQAELSALCDALDRGELAAVVGPAGMGKTTVVRAAVAGRHHHAGSGMAMLVNRRYAALETAVRRRLVGPPDEVADVVLDALDGAPLVLEDLHWVHESTLDVLGMLDDRVPMVVTTRPELGPRGDGLLGRARVVELEPLSGRTAERLARRLHPALGDEQRKELLVLAGGNPLLVERLVAADETVSPTLTDAVTERVRRLRIEDRRACGLVALLGRPVEPEILGSDFTAPTGDLAAIVEVLDDGRLALRHAALAAGVLSILDPEEVRALHAELAEVLDDAEGAPHAIAAGDLENGVRGALRGADHTDDVIVRAELLRLAAGVVDNDEGRADELHVRAATAFVDAGRHQDGMQEADLVSDRSPHLVADAAMQRARAQWFAGDVEAARAELERAARVVRGIDQEREVRIIVERAYLEARDRTPGALQWAEEALAIAEASGCEVVRARSNLGTALLYEARPEWEHVLRTALAEAEEAEDAELAATTAFHLMSGLGFMGRCIEAASVAAVQGPRATAAGLHRWATHIEVAALVHRLVLTRDPAALLADAERLLPGNRLFRNRFQLHLARASALLDLGRIDEAAVAIDEFGTEIAAAPDPAPEPRVSHALLMAELAWHLDDPDMAEEALGRGRAVLDAYFGLHLLTERTAGYVLVAKGRAFEPVLPTMTMPAWWPALTELEALAAWAGGDLRSAVALLEQTAQQWETMSFTRWAVRAGVLAADLDPVSRGRGRRRREWTDEARAAGLIGTLRRLGAPVNPALTVTEENILRLVAAGATTRRISEEMGISAGTVDHHVDSARRKLGAATRIEAARMVVP